jgi:hypothetical protein
MILASCIFILHLSCNQEEENKLLKVEANYKHNLIIIDSVWENTSVRELIDTSNKVTHRYYFKDSLTTILKYVLILDEEKVFEIDSLNKDYFYITGSNIHLLERVLDNENMFLSVLIGCPITFKECLSVDLISMQKNGETDTIAANYTPKGDVMVIKINHSNVR